MVSNAFGTATLTIGFFALLGLAGLGGWGFEKPKAKAATIQSVDARLSHLPTDLKLKESDPQKYQMFLITFRSILWAPQQAKKE